MWGESFPPKRPQPKVHAQPCLHPLPSSFSLAPRLCRQGSRAGSGRTGHGQQPSLKTGPGGTCSQQRAEFTCICMRCWPSGQCCCEGGSADPTCASRTLPAASTTPIAGGSIKQLVCRRWVASMHLGPSASQHPALWTSSLPQRQPPVAPAHQGSLMSWPAAAGGVQAAGKLLAAGCSAACCCKALLHTREAWEQQQPRAAAARNRYKADGQQTAARIAGLKQLCCLDLLVFRTPFWPAGQPKAAQLMLAVLRSLP